MRLGRAAIGLALRQHDRGLASDLPLLRLADELGYPDLETLLVAVADHTVSPDTVVDRLDRHRRPVAAVTAAGARAAGGDPSSLAL